MQRQEITKLYRERVIDNRQLKMLDVIKYLLNKPEVQCLDMAVGYFYISGLQLIKDDFIRFMDEKNGQVRILMGNETNGTTAALLNQQPYMDQVAKQSKKDTAQVQDDDFLSRVAEWLRDGRISVKVYTGDANYFHAKCYLFTHSRQDNDGTAIVGSSNFSRNGLQGNTELNVLSQDNYYALHNWYSDLWLSNEVQPFAQDLLKIVQEHYHPQHQQPRIYKPVKNTYYEFANIYGQPYARLDANQEWVVQLFPHQREGVRMIKDRLDSFGTAVLADGVGLGKTRTAAGVMRLYKDETAPTKAMIVADRKLENQWRRELATCGIDQRDYFWYSRDQFIQLSNREIKQLQYSLVIIDEAHLGFKNNNTEAYAKMRYFKHCHPQTKGLMMTATPWNNRREDVINIGMLFINPNSIPNDRNYKQYLIMGGFTNKMVRRLADDDVAFNQFWTDIFLQRTRKTYGGKKDLFAQRQFPTIQIHFEPQKNKIFSDNFDAIADLKFPYMDPIKYLDNSKEPLGAKQLKLLLLKRADSSWVAYRNTLQNIVDKLKRLQAELQLIQQWKGSELKRRYQALLSRAYKLEEYLFTNQIGGVFANSLDLETRDADGEKSKRSHLRKLQYLRKISEQIDNIKMPQAKKAVAQMRIDCEKDLNVLTRLLHRLNHAYAHVDEKLDKIIEVVSQEHQLGHKMIIISQFADTVQYYYHALYQHFNSKQTTLPMGQVLGGQGDNYINQTSVETKDKVLNYLSPHSKHQLDIIEDHTDIDLVVGTDTISTGQNLQDAVTLINLDLPYNPMNLEQRIGRIDRPRPGNRNEIYIYTCPIYSSIDSQLKMAQRLGAKMAGVLNDTQFDSVVLPEYQDYLEQMTKSNSQSQVAVGGGNAVKTMLDQTEDAATYHAGMSSERHSAQYQEANRRMYDFKINGAPKPGHYLDSKFSFSKGDAPSIAVIKLTLADNNGAKLKEETVTVDLTKGQVSSIVKAEQALHGSIAHDIRDEQQLSSKRAKQLIGQAQQQFQPVLKKIVNKYNEDQKSFATNMNALTDKVSDKAARELRVSTKKNPAIVIKGLKELGMEKSQFKALLSYIETVDSQDPLYDVVRLIADNVNYFWTHIKDYKQFLNYDTIQEAIHVGNDRQQVDTRLADLKHTKFNIILGNLVIA